MLYNLILANTVIKKPNLDYNKNILVFASYTIFFIGTNNTTRRRRVPGIDLNESNKWGGHFCMSLCIGKKLQSYEWEEFTIDDEVIEKVYELSEKEGQTPPPDNYPMFEWSPCKNY